MLFVRAIFKLDQEAGDLIPESSLGTSSPLQLALCGSIALAILAVVGILTAPSDGKREEWNDS